MISCKHCGNIRVVKNGNIKSKQRYLCKSCNKTFREGDNRQKYSIEQKIRVFKLYTEGMGLRSIERLENIPSSLLVRWIRGFAKIVKEKVNTTEVPSEVKDIAILEMDELLTYYQKKARKPMCGLLWTETGMSLLIL